MRYSQTTNKRIITRMRNALLFLGSFVALLVILLVIFLIGINKKSMIRPADTTPVESTTWEFQSIDTMKYSRDLAREKGADPSFDTVINQQVKAIAETGVTHVAIATPYDDEFVPFLKRWVDAARKYDLNVWYRGNWSGWEGWFGYPEITREEHIKKSVQFIKDYPELFQSGDIFSACPECENGGPGDPRATRDFKGHQKFLIDEYKAVSEIFRLMGKNVKSNFSPMNGDVANAIMDAETTKALGGVVVVDHYVGTGKELARDLENLAKKSKGKVVLGEFGVPIGDIHGNFTQEEQAKWIGDALEDISKVTDLRGINYWVANGGSTQIWNDNGTPRHAVKVLTSYFKPKTLRGVVYNELNEPIPNAEVVYNTTYITTDLNGNFSIKDNAIQGKATVFANGYKQKDILIDEQHPNVNVILEKVTEGPIFKLRKFLINL